MTDDQIIAQVLGIVAHIRQALAKLQASDNDAAVH